jgi:hypothetical protein
MMKHADTSGGLDASGEAKGSFSYLSFTPILIFAILVGVTNLLQPLLEYFKARRAVYSVTNNRILTLETGRSRKVRSYVKDEIGDLSRNEHRDGSGDLIFAKRISKDSDSDLRTEEIKLVGIPEVRTVEKLVRDLFKREGG